MIITICGSYRFEKEMREVYKKLTERGHIVLCPAGPNVNMSIKALHDLHDSKVAMSDAIYVVDKGGYYGENTKREIEYAKSLDKDILWYSEGD